MSKSPKTLIMATKRKYTLPRARKQEIAAEIERQRNAQVIHVNEPNPVLMQVAMDEIIAANLQALEEQRAQAADAAESISNNSPVQPAVRAHWVTSSSAT
jgi:hypothetical protein